jgi:hypothetical protein
MTTYAVVCQGPDAFITNGSIDLNFTNLDVKGKLAVLRQLFGSNRNLKNIIK